MPEKKAPKSLVWLLVLSCAHGSSHGIITLLSFRTPQHVSRTLSERTGVLEGAHLPGQ